MKARCEPRPVFLAAEFEDYIDCGLDFYRLSIQEIWFVLPLGHAPQSRSSQ